MQEIFQIKFSSLTNKKEAFNSLKNGFTSWAKAKRFEIFIDKKFNTFYTLITNVSLTAKQRKNLKNRIKQILKISELMPGMKKVNLVGEIIEMFPVREYNKNNRQGKIGSFVIADETGNLRVVLWDTSHIELIEREEIKKGDVVEIKNASMRDNELHLSGFSEIKKSDKVLENVKREIIAPRKSIKELQPGQRVEVRGVIVQLFNPRFFNVCPECLKKVVQDSNGFSCAEHGRVQPKERALLNFVLDDGTETIRVVLFSEQIEKIIPEEDLKNPEKLEIFRKDYLGKEVLVKGVVKKNQLFNNMEIIGENIEEVDVDKLIEELEKSL